ncbi:MAG: glycerol-3-phosphate dehydrogenase/oxidase [Planctomycetes bacterium]|nr:glycerol-3-phosphate dehydrogenase/oxidase [Planctomycetota bacterium]
MRASESALSGRRFQLVVIGGGIQGLAIAREAALAGASVLVLEQEDFGAGTSSRSSKLIHGGVRYLEQGRLGLLREALHERERLLRQAPHLVRPVPMLMPFFADGGKSPLLLRLGLLLYQLLAGRSTLPRPRQLTSARCLAAFPGLRSRGLLGGSLYWDAATQDQRLTLAVAIDAAECGAHLLNHAGVVGVRGDALVVRGTEGEWSVRAEAIVNAAGPHADPVRRLLGIDGPDLVRVSRGSHLVLAPRAGETALAAFLPDGRIQFVIPHPDGTVVGTTEVEEALADTPTVPEEDVRYLLDALAYLLEAPPARDAVRAAWGGWRSLPQGRGAAGVLRREAHTVAERSAAGIVHTVVGGKLTTHRAFGERVARALRFGRGPSPTRTRPLPGGEGPHEPADPLWQRHGSRAAEVRALCAARPALARPLCPHLGFLAAEAVHALRSQAVVTFEDLMLRRLVHLQGPCLEPECLRTAFEHFAAERPAAPAFADAVAGLRAAVARRDGALRGAGGSGPS